jgi:hypothetical protein
MGFQLLEQFRRSQPFVIVQIKQTDYNLDKLFAVFLVLLVLLVPKRNIFQLLYFRIQLFIVKFVLLNVVQAIHWPQQARVK